MSRETAAADPVLEMAVLNVRAGQAAHFLTAFGEARAIIQSMPGCLRHEVRRSAETPDRFLLLVWWDSIESHTEGFRQSPEYQRWKQLLHHFYEPFPVVEHYLSID